MAYLQSVGVQVTETDLTPVTQPTSASIGLFVGHFNWGPAANIVNVDSETTLGRIFGAPKKTADINAPSFLTAESFLKYGNSLKVVRVVDVDTARNSKAIFTSDVSDYSSSETNLTIYTHEGDFELRSTDPSYDNDGGFYARYPGVLGNSLAISVFHADNASDESNVDEIRTKFTYSPTNTIWNEQQGDNGIPLYENDEIHIAVYDKNGLFTGVKGTILEVWEGLSLSSEARTTANVSNYFADIINRSSAYIYAVNETEIFNFNADTFSLKAPLASVLTKDLGKYSFILGSDGSTNASDRISDIVNVLDPSVNSSVQLSDVDNIDFNLVFAEAVEGDPDALVNVAISDLVNERKDCIGFISAPLSLWRYSSDDLKKDALLLYKDQISNPTSYVVFDSSPVYVYNKYADRFEWIPTCGHMAGLCAYTDEVNDPWFSPAGLNRGQLRGITKIAYNPKQIDRDELYNNNINPIVNMPGSGIVLWGDKTGQKKTSAFDRINVRRLFIVLQRTCREAAKFQLFELNDEFTRNAFINIVEPYLRDVKGRRGITEFKIVCNEKNNTPQVIDSNQFVADIYIKPARSINYITLNFIATRTGVSFTEIGA
jgi:hypothetical protein